MQIIESIVSHGCFLRDCSVEHSLIGLRSRIESGVAVKVELFQVPWCVSWFMHAIYWFLLLKGVVLLKEFNASNLFYCLKSTRSKCTRWYLDLYRTRWCLEQIPTKLMRNELPCLLLGKCPWELVKTQKSGASLRPSDARVSNIGSKFDIVAVRETTNFAE